MFDFQGVL